MVEAIELSQDSSPSTALLIVVPNNLKVGGGQEQDILQLARQLALGPFRVHVADSDCFLREERRLTDEAISTRLGPVPRTTIHSIPVLRRLTSIPTLRGARQLRDLMVASDLVLTCPFYLEDSAIALLTRLAHRPLYASQNNAFIHRVRGDPRQALQDLWNRLIGVRLLRSVAGVRTLSVDEQGTLGSFGISRTVVVYPTPARGVAEGPSPTIRSTSGPRGSEGALTTPELRVLVAGRMTAQKGVATLAEILRLVRDRKDSFGRFRFLLAGTKHLPHKIGRFVQEMPDRVENLGFVPEGLSNVFQQVDVLLMPSFYESLGMTAIDAIRQGVPVVASDVSGLREVVRPGETGWLAPPGHPAEFVRALDVSLELKTTNPAGWEELRSRCRDSYVRRFGPGVWEAQYARLVESLRNAARASS